METDPAAAVEISEDLSTRELAIAAKARGNKAHGLNTLEGFVVAVAAYKEAISYDPTDHIFYANLCASYIELSKVKWKPGEVVDAAAKAVEAANKCTAMAPTWAKGFLRQATAEESLVKARAKWKEALAKPKTQWDEEQAARDGPEPQPAKELLSTIEGLSLAKCEATCRAGLVLDPSSAPLKMKLQALRDEGHATDEASDKAMSDVALAAPLKAEGNALFSSKQFEKAAEKYTEALAMSPVGEGAHILYSNRSACHAELDAGGEWVGNQGSKALHDAEMCIKLSPGFAKGFSRKSAALYHLGKYVDAEAAARAGLAIDPANAALQSLLETAKAETAETAEVQVKMHEMRKSQAKDAKLKSMLSGLNLGNNVQMFSPGMGGGGGLGGLESLFGGGGGGGGFGGLGGGGFGGGAPAMTDDQMRQIARATATGGTAATATENGTPQMSTRDRWRAQMEEDSCCTSPKGGECAAPKTGGG